MKTKIQRAKHQRTHYLNRRALINEAKNKPCSDCGIKYPSYVMQFDHREPKKKVFTIGPDFSSYGRNAILKEIEKCDVVCANCHAERTYGVK